MIRPVVFGRQPAASIQTSDAIEAPFSPSSSSVQGGCVAQRLIVLFLQVVVVRILVASSPTLQNGFHGTDWAEPTPNVSGGKPPNIERTEHQCSFIDRFAELHPSQVRRFDYQCR
jgi:hypothetical protein